MDIIKLKGVIPESVYKELPSVITKYKIDTTLKLSHFLSQCDHESGGFKRTFENLNYSKSGLLRVFKKYFPGNLAASYAMKPELIGSRVYANRMGNGDEASKEGYKFRGRGYLQMTGKETYGLLGKEFNEDLIKNPDLVAVKYPLSSSAWFFTNKNIWSLCNGSTDDDVENVTKKINGGTNGLDERIKLFKKYHKILG